MLVYIDTGPTEGWSEAWDLNKIFVDVFRHLEYSQNSAAHFEEKLSLVVLGLSIVSTEDIWRKDAILEGCSFMNTLIFPTLLHSPKAPGKTCSQFPWKFMNIQKVHNPDLWGSLHERTEFLFRDCAVKQDSLGTSTNTNSRFNPAVCASYTLGSTSCNTVQRS